MSSKLQAFGLLAIALLISNPAIAKNSAEKIEIEKLKARLAALEEKIAQDEKQKPDNSADDVIVKLKPSPSFKTRDGKTSFNLDGRILVDAGAITKGKSSTMNDNISLRRFWIGVGGQVDQDWSYRALVGFENNQTNIADAVVNYHGLKNADILIGHFFENNGIEISTVNLLPTFMEFSSGISTFRPVRRVGVSVDPYGENWGAHFGFFGSSVNNSTTSTTNANNKGRSFSSRAHIALINDKKAQNFLHLGFNSTYRTLENSDLTTGSNKTMRFNSVSDSNVLNTTLIDTGNIINVNNFYQNMAEFRYQAGSFSLTSEYIKTTLNRAAGLQNLEFKGGYLTTSYFLTGEKYGYDSKLGVPTAPMIGNKGAWEIGARYSLTDLNNKTVNGGSLNSYDLALNYYPNNHIRFMMNYIFNHTDQAGQIKSNPQYLIARMQLSF